MHRPVGFKGSIWHDEDYIFRAVHELYRPSLQNINWNRNLGDIDLERDAESEYQSGKSI
ncbi:hypothetical protein [Sphingobacterium deserti]|nr:hypothetical protein [Sphingobacterium deserti]